MRNILWGALGVLLFGSAAAAMDITAPGVTVPTGQTGVVQADLTCGPGQAGIRLEHRARLDLNGHVLDGCDVTVAGLENERRIAKVRGPGTLRNAGISIRAGKLIVTDVTIVDPPVYGLSGNFNALFQEPGTVVAKRVTSTGPAEVHIHASGVQATDVIVSGATQDGIQASTIRGTRIQTTQNAYSGLSTTGGAVRLRDLTSTDNGCGGVSAFRVVIRGGTVTNNSADGVSPPCADIYSTVPPRIVRVVCGLSSNTNGELAEPWGVCEND